MKRLIVANCYSISTREGGGGKECLMRPGNPLVAPSSSIYLIDHSRGNNRDKSAKTSSQHTPVSANIRVTIYLIILIMESLCSSTSTITPDWVYDLLLLPNGCMIYRD